MDKAPLLEHLRKMNPLEKYKPHLSPREGITMSRSQVPRVTELKPESTTQAEASTTETQKLVWDGQKMGARNWKAAKESAFIMNHVCREGGAPPGGMGGQEG